MKRTDERNEFLTDVLSTAVEGGIGYWANVHAYRWTPENPAERHATVRDHQTARGAEIRVDLDALASAIRKIVAGEVNLADDYRRRIQLATRENDCGELDSLDCDAIFQVAALGDVIYG